MSSETPFPGLVGTAAQASTIAQALEANNVTFDGEGVPEVDETQRATAAALWFAYLNEAATMLEQGYATRDDIDASMRFGCGYSAGPLQQLDAIGLDNAVAVLDALHAASGDRRHIASSALKDRVASGETGIDSGKGFYTYAAAGSDEITDATGPATSGGAATREINKVGVVGTGTMATGIIEVFAKAGNEVIYVARSDEKVANVRAALEKSLGRQVDKGRLSEDDRDAVLGRVSGVTDHAGLSEVDIVVEAIVEDLDTKKALFESLDKNCKPGAILATTTSSLSIDTLAATTSRPADVIGMHFFNPAPIMKLVEVVTGKETAADVTATVLDLCGSTKKYPVLCSDRAGFIVNFLLFPYLNDAVRAVEADISTIEQLDTLMKPWQSIPMGPFALLDVVGNDVSLAIEEVIEGAFGGAEYVPAPLLVETVQAGKLGRKTGEGFLNYA